MRRSNLRQMHSRKMEYDTIFPPSHFSIFHFISFHVCFLFPPPLLPLLLSLFPFSSLLLPLSLTPPMHAEVTGLTTGPCSPAIGLCEYLCPPINATCPKCACPDDSTTTCQESGKKCYTHVLYMFIRLGLWLAHRPSL